MFDNVTLSVCSCFPISLLNCHFHHSHPHYGNKIQARHAIPLLRRTFLRITIKMLPSISLILTRPSLSPIISGYYRINTLPVGPLDLKGWLPVPDHRSNMIITKTATTDLTTSSLAIPSSVTLSHTCLLSIPPSLLIIGINLICWVSSEWIHTPSLCVVASSGHPG